MGDNPFSVQVVNPLQALLLGQKAYTDGQEVNKQQALTDARTQAGQLYSAGDTMGALAKLLMGGDLQGAGTYSGLDQQQYQRGRDTTTDARTASQDALNAQHWNATFGLQKRAADRADDPTPDNFVADPNSPGGYRPIGPADPNYKASVARAEALAKGDVPTIMGANSSVVVPNKVGADGPIFTNKPAPGAQLDDDTLTSMAGQYLAGDKSVFTNIGRGAQGAENIIRLRSRVKDLAEAQGMSPADTAHRIAEFSGDMASQRTLGVRQTNADMAVTEAQKMSDLALAASQKFDRSRFPKVNMAIQSYKENTGDPDVMRFGAANLAFVNTYARAISPQGTPTVHDKIAAVAEGKLSTTNSPEQYAAVVDQMKQEMAAAKAAPAQVKQDLRDAASGRHTPAPQITPPKPGQLIQGYRFKGGDPADQNNWAKAQ